MIMGGWKNDFCVNNLHIPIKVIIFAVEKGIADNDGSNPFGLLQTSPVFIE